MQLQSRCAPRPSRVRPCRGQLHVRRRTSPPPRPDFRDLFCPSTRVSDHVQRTVHVEEIPPGVPRAPAPEHLPNRRSAERRSPTRHRGSHVDPVAAQRGVDGDQASCHGPPRHPGSRPPPPDRTAGSLGGRHDSGDGHLVGTQESLDASCFDWPPSCSVDSAGRMCERWHRLPTVVVP